MPPHLLVFSPCFSSYHSFSYYFFFFFNDPATTEIYPLSLHDPLPISETVSRGVVKNRSRKDSSVSSLPSVCSTACWLIPFLLQTDIASGGPNLPIRRNSARRERSWRTRAARRIAEWCGVKRSAVSPHTDCIERYGD